MHKIVNGVQVELSPEEEASILAEWERNRFPERKKTITELLRDLDDVTVAALTTPATEWALLQNDNFIQSLTNSEEQTNLLVATWLFNNPQGAMNQGVNFNVIIRG